MFMVNQLGQYTCPRFMNDQLWDYGCYEKIGETLWECFLGINRGDEIFLPSY